MGKMTVYDSDVIACACRWWDGKRPVALTLVQHLDNPTVNCTTQRECDLALMVAEWYRAKHKPTRRRCGAIGPRGSFQVCGRWEGHDGDHMEMGCVEGWAQKVAS